MRHRSRRRADRPAAPWRDAASKFQLAAREDTSDQRKARYTRLNASTLKSPSTARRNYPLETHCKPPTAKLPPAQREQCRAEDTRDEVWRKFTFPCLRHRSTSFNSFNCGSSETKPRPKFDRLEYIFESISTLTSNTFAPIPSSAGRVVRPVLANVASAKAPPGHRELRFAQPSNTSPAPSPPSIRTQSPPRNPLSDTSDPIQDNWTSSDQPSPQQPVNLLASWFRIVGNEKFLAAAAVHCETEGLRHATGCCRCLQKTKQDPSAIENGNKCAEFWGEREERGPSSKIRWFRLSEKPAMVIYVLYRNK